MKADEQRRAGGTRPQGVSLDRIARGTGDRLLDRRHLFGRRRRRGVRWRFSRIRADFFLELILQAAIGRMPPRPLVQFGVAPRRFSSRWTRELSGRLGAPERISSQIFRMLAEHVDPSERKFRHNGEKVDW
jgi:hypothetical protein